MKRNKLLEKIRAAISPEENVRYDNIIEQQWGINDEFNLGFSASKKQTEKISRDTLNRLKSELSELNRTKLMKSYDIDKIKTLEYCIAQIETIKWKIGQHR